MSETGKLNEEAAMLLVEQAVELAGGSRAVYRNPRHPFALNQTTRFDIDGHSIELRHGEVSSPAIVTVDRYVFEIHEESIEFLMILPPKSPQQR